MAVVINGTTGIDKVQDGSIVSADLDTNITVSGDLTVDTSTLKVDSTNNKVGIGTSSPQDHLHVIGGGGGKIRIGETTTRYTQIQGAASGSGLEADTLFYNTNSSGTSTVNLTLTGSGRGISQFTAKAWVNYKGLGGNTVRDSHNVSSVTDNNAGRYTINFANAMANVNYVPLNGNVGYQMNVGDNRFFQVVSSQSTTTLGISNVMAQNGFNYTDADYVFIAIFGD